MKICNVFILFIVCLFYNNNTPLMAQNNATVNGKFWDAVYLKDSSIFRGQIMVYKADESVTIRDLAKREWTFSMDKVAKIVQEPVPGSYNVVVFPYNFRERGFYNATNIGVMMQNNDANDNINLGVDVDYGFSTSFGWKFNRFIGLGAGAGMHNYYDSDIYSAFGELRGYVLKTPFSPYYTMAVGYGFPSSKGGTVGNGDYYTRTTNEGGLMLYPAIGVRVGASKYLNFTIDVGMQYQKASVNYYTSGSLLPEPYEDHYDYVYRRWALRIGVLF